MANTVVSNSYLSNNPDIRVATVAKSGAVYQLMGNGLVPEAYDEIAMSYTGANLTQVVYKLETITIATLTLSYSGDNLTSVVRS